MNLFMYAGRSKMENTGLSVSNHIARQIKKIKYKYINKQWESIIQEASLSLSKMFNHYFRNVLLFSKI